MALIMGIDAGFSACGIVAATADRRIVFADAVKTSPSNRKRGVRVADDDAERCMALTQFIRQAIEDVKPLGAVVELPTGGAQGARANRAMGMATGVVVAVIDLLGLPSEWVRPEDVKLVAGRKDASKEQVQEAVLELFDWGVLWPPTKWMREHIADAAAALIAAQTGVLMRTLERVA